MRHVAIITPVYREVEPDFTFSLVRTLRIGGVDFTWLHCVGHTNLPRARNILTDDARKSGADEVFYIDADMGWEPEAVVELFSLPSSLGIIGGAPEKRDGKGFAAIPDMTNCKQAGPLISGIPPTAFMRVPGKVFDTLQAHVPTFEYEGRTVPMFFGQSIGPNGFLRDDDVHFVETARSHGIDSWIHPGLPLRHWGHSPKTRIMADALTITKEEAA